MVSAMCGVELSGRKTQHLMLTSFLIETIDQLSIANSVRWDGGVLRREDGHVLRWALEFEVEGERKKGRMKTRMKGQIED